MSTVTALTDTQRTALKEQAYRCGQTWHPTENPNGWASLAGLRTKRTMGVLVTAGMLERRYRGGVYQYALTEAGRKELER